MGYRLDNKVFWQPASELVTFSHFLAVVRPFLHISSDILDNLQKAEPICFPNFFEKFTNYYFSFLERKSIWIFVMPWLATKIELF